MATKHQIGLDKAKSKSLQGVPTLIVFKNGEIKWRQSGVVSANNLQQIISQDSN